MTAQHLAEMSQAELQALPHDLVQQIVAKEIEKAALLKRRLQSLKKGTARDDSCESIACALGISAQGVREIEQRALLKLKRKPELRQLLTQTTNS